MNNGLTICRPCHKKTDSFGWNQWNKINIIMSKELI